MKIVFLALAVAVAMSMPWNIGAQSSLNSILATVDGDPITLLDVISDTNEREERISSVYSGSAPAGDIEKIRKDALEEIIDDKLLLAEFKRRGYKVPPQMVERMIDSVASEIAEGDRRRLSELAEKNKMSIEKLRRKAEDRAAIELMVNEFCSRHISASPREVRERASISKAAGGGAPRVELLVIFISNDAEGETAKAELVRKIGEDVKQNNRNIFATLAKLYSESHSASKGGSLGWVEKDKLRPEFAKALEGLDAGKTVGPLETPEGRYFLFLAGAESGAGAPKDDALALDEAREAILDEKRAAARRDFVSGLRKKAIIRYFQ